MGKHNWLTAAVLIPLSITRQPMQRPSISTSACVPKRLLSYPETRPASQVLFPDDSTRVQDPSRPGKLTMATVQRHGRAVTTCRRRLCFNDCYSVVGKGLEWAWKAGGRTRCSSDACRKSRVDVAARHSVSGPCPGSAELSTAGGISFCQYWADSANRIIHARRSHVFIWCCCHVAEEVR